MLIDRKISKKIESKLFKGKAIVLYGPRQVGKTTLVKEILKLHEGLYLNADEPDIRDSLTDTTSTALKSLIGENKLVVIDEAQRVKNIGITIKLLVDTFPNLQVIATGSSSFELSNTVKESLTGRAYEYHLYPLSVGELSKEAGSTEPRRSLERYLRFGTYPEIVTNPTESETLLSTLANNYLYKDALVYQDLRNTEVIDSLLRALALQIGNEVSYSELANTLNIDLKTVRKYIRILEQSFIVFRLPPLHRNARKELTKKRKIYFWDNGIRNSIIRNFNELRFRDDVGSLWENFLISQRVISREYQGKTPNVYFWRTWDKAEIDYVEERSGKIAGYEIKWGNKDAKAPALWKELYPDASFETINKENFLRFLN